MEEKKKGAELTIGDVFALIKKGWVRIVAYILIAAVVVGGITIGIMIGTSSEDSYQAMVSFNYEGVEKGFDPWGGSLDISNIKSDAIVLKALKDNGFVTDNEERTTIKNNIISNISIAGVVPEDTMKKILIIKDIATKNPSQLNDLNDLSYYSTSYVITITKSNKINLKKNDYINILNAIVNEYAEDFKAKYGFSDVLGSAIAGDINIEQYDYIELVDLYETQINDMIYYLETRISNNSDYRTTSTKLSFQDMENRLLRLKNFDLKQMQTFIFKEGLAKDNISVNADVYIEEKLNDYDREIARQEILIEAVATKKDINNTPLDLTDDQYVMNYEPQYNTTETSDGATIRTLANGDDYTLMLNKFTTYQTKLADLNNLKSLWTDRQSSFGNNSTAEEKAIGDVMISNLDTQLKVEAEIINDGVQEYIDNEVLKEAVSISVAANAQDKDNLSFSLLGIILIVTIIIAFVIALGVTSKKGNKINIKVKNEDEEKNI
ncbi:MAG: hypothetical protein WCR54_06650 [Clostridia bacterium]